MVISNQPRAWKTMIIAWLLSFLSIPLFSKKISVGTYITPHPTCLNLKEHI
jgi:hypothetical protein